jgi:hypothetical protein
MNKKCRERLAEPSLEEDEDEGGAFCFGVLAGFIVLLLSR